MKRVSKFAFLAALPLGIAAIAAPAHAVDWSSVQGKDVTLFYPGQASWEWVLTPADHSGAPKFREGKNCKQCHAGEAKDMGALIASGKKREPTPVAGKRGSVVANVKMAHDGDKFYARFEWPDAGEPAQKMAADFAARVTMMFDDGKVKEAGRAGCWGVCHDDATDMESAGGKERKKYLSASRAKITRQGGGDNMKGQGDLDQMKAGGVFLEYWQARLNPGAAAVAVDGHILEKRTDHEKPIVTAEGKLDGGKWVVVLSRKMKAGDPSYKDIVPGGVYNVGFAIHDQYTWHRFHHVSFEHTFAVDQGEADFVAVKK